MAYFLGGGVIANRVYGLGRKINRKCADVLGISDAPEIIKKTKKFSLYWWFNELPLYKSSYLKDFFKWLDSNGRIEAVYNNFECFDYIVYVYWLILYKDIKIINKGGRYTIGIIEELGHLEARKAISVRQSIKIEQLFGTHWTTRLSCLDSNDSNKSICICFHRDRWDIWKKNKSLPKEIMRWVYFKCIRYFCFPNPR